MDDYEIITGMAQVWDYQEYHSACAAAGREPQPPHIFAQTAGMIHMAQYYYPGEGVRKGVMLLYRGEFPGVSRGLGDTVAKVAHAVGLDRVAQAYTRFTGKDCGCKGRREKLNQMFPYK